MATRDNGRPYLVLVRNPADIIVGRDGENRVVEILRVLQEAAIEGSGRGEESISPTTQETITIIRFERYTINSERYQEF